MNDLVVDFCSYRAAKYAGTHWHYSKSMPTPPVYRLGVWEKGGFIGVVIFSRGATSNLGKKFGLKNTQVCELSRIALSTHVSMVSRIASIAIRVLNNSQNIRLIYSYADPNQGHVGTIYQAMNFIYTGSTPKSVLYRDHTGRVWHGRQVSSSGWKKQYGENRRVPKIKDCEKIKQLGKHRYLYPLDKSMRRQVLKLSKPYPKR